MYAFKTVLSKYISEIKVSNSVLFEGRFALLDLNFENKIDLEENSTELN